MDPTRLRANLESVRERIERARGRRGHAAPVEIVAVTKGHPFEAVEVAVEVGLRACGENRVQELQSKAERLAGTPAGVAVEWHLIGHLQRNKVRQALPLARLIHSVDSIRLARELSREAARAGAEARILVQVNTSGEGSKGGFEAPEAVAAVARIGELPALRILGLMTMAPLTDDEGVLRATFERTRRLDEECRRSAGSYEGRHLSMGMSNDFELAVEEGSTMVRLGTVLFGERPT